MSTVAKIFTNILSNRIKHYLENNSLLADEQNGFRQGRSCQDHIFSLTTIIRNRINEKKPTYSCFVDMAKAFDSVHHEILWNVLQKFGIKGKIFKVTQYMYSNLQAAINLGGHLTEWFQIKGGVRQGDNLAPTLFAMFMNSLSEEINSLNCGITIEDNLSLSILLFADDIVLLSESELGLQTQINTLENWTKNFRMAINLDKTKIVHFRPKTIPEQNINSN